MALKSLSKVLVFVNYHISRREHSLFYGEAQWVVILMQIFLASSIPQWGHGYIFTKYIFPSVTIMSQASVITETFEMFLILRDFSGTKLLKRQYYKNCGHSNQHGDKPECCLLPFFL